MKTTTVTLRRRLLGVLTGTALCGAVTAALVGPSATASKDPCTASEVARTVGSVAKSAGDYLDSHPEANQAMTSVLQQPAGAQSIGGLNAYFEANPKVKNEMQSVTDPLAVLATKCKLSISLPQVLGLMQAPQGQGGLPGGAGTGTVPPAGAVPPVSDGSTPAGGANPQPGSTALPPGVLR